jgi:hypothetical protein
MIEINYLALFFAFWIMFSHIFSGFHINFTFYNWYLFCYNYYSWFPVCVCVCVCVYVCVHVDLSFQFSLSIFSLSQYIFNEFLFSNILLGRIYFFSFISHLILKSFLRFSPLGYLVDKNRNLFFEQCIFCYLSLLCYDFYVPFLYSG